MPDLAVIPGRRAAAHARFVDTMAEFESLRDAWQRLEAIDPEGTVFLSWDWLAEAFRANDRKWRVIAAFRGEQLIGVLPLKYRVHWSRTRNEFQSEIEAGGRLLWSEYTGFLLDPDHQVEALALIAERVQKMPWSRLSLRYEISRDRAERFLSLFPSSSYAARFKKYRINNGETDNLACPRVQLPDTFDSYVQSLPSAGMRQKIRRFTRKHLDSGDLRLKISDNAGFDSDCTGLQRLWQARWQVVKGADVAAQVAENYGTILRAAQMQGNAHIATLWRGNERLGALGHILDRRHKRMHFIVAGRDPDLDASYIGLLLHSQSIRWAIENGFAEYDFCHGNERYKYSFGAQDVRVRYFSIRPTGVAAPGSRFDPISRVQAMGRVLEFIEKGRPDRAAAGCRQLLPLMR